MSDTQLVLKRYTNEIDDGKGRCVGMRKSHVCWGMGVGDEVDPRDHEGIGIGRVEVGSLVRPERKSTGVLSAF